MVDLTCEIPVVGFRAGDILLPHSFALMNAAGTRGPFVRESTMKTTPLSLSARLFAQEAMTPSRRVKVSCAAITREPRFCLIWRRPAGRRILERTRARTGIDRWPITGRGRKNNARLRPSRLFRRRVPRSLRSLSLSRRSRRGVAAHGNCTRDKRPSAAPPRGEARRHRLVLSLRDSPALESASDAR